MTQVEISAGYSQKNVHSLLRSVQCLSLKKGKHVSPFYVLSFNHKINLLLYLLSFVETPRKFVIAELSIRKLGSSSVLIIRLFEFTRPFLWIKTSYYHKFDPMSLPNHYFTLPTFEHKISGDFSLTL